MTRVRRTVLVLAVFMVLAVSACSSDSSSDDANPGPSTTGGAGTSRTDTPATAKAGEHPCAWATRADKATLNVAYPDTAATYWALSYRLAPGERIELDGTLPDARYFSFITYRPAGGAVAR